MKATAKATARKKSSNQRANGDAMSVVFYGYFGKSIDVQVDQDDSAWLQAEPANDER